MTESTYEQELALALQQLQMDLDTVKQQTRKPLGWVIALGIAALLNTWIKFADLDPVNHLVSIEKQYASQAGQYIAGKIPAFTAQQNVTVASRFINYDENTHKTVLANFIKQNADLHINPSTTAWCAAFVNGVLGSQGIEGTGKLNAKSFLHIGESVKYAPQQGDIVVFDRGKPGSWQGHVGFYMGEESRRGKRYIKVLGGNQGNKVSIANYNASRLIDIRRVGVIGIDEDWIKAIEKESRSWLTKARQNISRLFKREKKVVPAEPILASISAQQWSRYSQLMACFESRNEKTVDACLAKRGGNYYLVNEYYYMGRYQLGAAGLCDAKLIKQSYCDSMYRCSTMDNPGKQCNPWIKVAKGLQPEHGKFLKNPASWENSSATVFLKDKDIQDKAFRMYTLANIKRGYKNGALDAYSTASEVLSYAAGAHLKGHSAAMQYLIYGRDSDDRNDMRVSHYVTTTRNYIN